MRLVSFTVTKYRSIKRAHKIKVGQQTVLVGPNNEGKSNLLRALVMAMQVLRSVRSIQVQGTSRQVLLRRGGYGYEHERDFPQDLQAGDRNGSTEIQLEFELDPTEIAEFRRSVGSALNGTLPIKVSFGQDGEPSISVVKKGPGGAALTAKAPVVARFVSERVNFEHIPAVRTASAAEEIVNRMVEQELATLDQDEEFKRALESIAALQEPILERLSESIKQTLQQFLPHVDAVHVQIPQEERYRALRSRCRIIIDDGTPTMLQYKGDGVQSLAALGIMRHASVSAASGRNSIIAIEEPESHLHPGAIHELRQVLNELAAKHQLVLTTHNPLFVDRSSLRNNVIVRNSKATPATSIAQLREILGVRASDNLRRAELVLVVEGEDDARAITAILAGHSPSLKRALASNTLAIDSLNGASNLPYKIGEIRSALCTVHCFLDNDNAGRRAFDIARLEGLLTDAEVNWATVDGSSDSELEDFYDPEQYRQMISTSYGVSLEAPEFQTARKWSDRMDRTFRRQGKRWDDRVEREVKSRLAEIVAGRPEFAILPARKGPIYGLVTSLEARLG